MPLGILVAELKGQEPSQYGRKLTFKHLPDYSFFIDHDLAKQFDRIAGDKIEMVEATLNTHLIVIATFSPKATHANIREIAVMPVNGLWIPFDGEREYELVEALGSRDFVKCLKYNLTSAAPIANALLLDAEAPIALYTPAADLSAEAEDELRNIAAEGVYPAWLWSASDPDMPELPGIFGQR